jgi:tetratricopeptide (TPR) repeat protein
MDSIAAWEAFESGDYELAQARWHELLSNAKSQEDRDSANWGLGYVLVKVGKFSNAKQIWEDIFNRTGDHKALHQIGMVERDSGQPTEAFEVFLKESKMISDSDLLAKAVNLYELSYCSLLMGNLDLAEHYLEQYRDFTGKGGDPIEEACFFRLEGDVYSTIDPERARLSYELSLKKFQRAQESTGASEVLQRLSALRDRI